jgi:hypothetical protein
MVYTENERPTLGRRLSQEEGFSADSVVTVFGSYLGGATWTMTAIRGRRS